MIHNYSDLISIENLFQAWNEFKKGKRKKLDVQAFEQNLEDNLFEAHHLLLTKKYKHGNYEEFYVNDPKRRHIHKARVVDRVIHHLLYKYLYEIFDKHFIFDSYSCRNEKGTHNAVERCAKFIRQKSKNYSSSCWVLHLDIKRFFASVNHAILYELLEKKIEDKDILWLLSEVICSFSSDTGEKKGIPLGNLTSQIFSNIYLNELDKFVKHTLRVKYYIRYADDFVIISKNNLNTNQLTSRLGSFLQNELKLTLHPNKIILRKLTWGIDFLGYIILPHYILPRKSTVKRMCKNLEELYGAPGFEQSLASYVGFLSHANSYKLKQKLSRKFDL